MNTGTYRLSVGIKGIACTLVPANALQSLYANPSESVLQSLSFGTGTGNGNLIVVEELTIAASSSVSINLYDGSLLDLFQQPAPFRFLRSFVAWVNSGGDATGVTIAPAASNPNLLWWTGTSPTKTVYPGGPPECGGSPAGVAVTSSAYGVTFTNNSSTAAVTVGLALAGSNA